jgi:hypothetical protein
MCVLKGPILQKILYEVERENYSNNVVLINKKVPRALVYNSIFDFC